MAEQVAVVGGRCLHGIDGFVHDVHGLAYDDPVDVGKGVRALLDSPSRRAALAEAGRVLVGQRPDWAAVAARYIETLPRTQARRVAGP
jgi:hypothetical protein